MQVIPSKIFSYYFVFVVDRKFYNYAKFRKKNIIISYQDENFNTLEEEYYGIKARIIQHEYDHIEGILFTDYLSSIKKRLIKGKLNDISKGKIQVDYRMKFYLKKRK